MAKQVDRGKHPIALNFPTQIEKDIKESVDRIEKKFRPYMKTFRKSATTRINQNEKLIR